MMEKDKSSLSQTEIGDADEQMLRSFFASHQLDVPDNGFSDRVMAALPVGKVYRIARLWTWICIVLAALLLVFGNGWQCLKEGFAVCRVQGQLSLAHLAEGFSSGMPASSTLLMLLAGAGILLVVWGFDEVIDS